MNTDASRVVLCVMSHTQYADYRDLLETMCAVGAELVFQPSAEDALEQLKALDPGLMLIGMDLGSMEGLELLAMCRNRYRALPLSVAVLPEMGDPFPAIVQTCDGVGGQTTTAETNLSEVATMIAAVAAGPQHPVSITLRVPESIAREGSAHEAGEDRPTMRPRLASTVLVADGSASVLAICREAAAQADRPVEVNTCTVQRCPTAAAIQCPLAIVIPQRLFALDAAEFTALCTDVRAALIVVPERVDGDALRAHLRDVCRRGTNDHG